MKNDVHSTCGLNGEITEGAEVVPRVHALKCWPIFFEEVVALRKAFEIRHNDRSFRVGDILRLREWSPVACTYTGREAFHTVTYLTDFEQRPGFVVMSLGYCSLRTTESRIDEISR